MKFGVAIVPHDLEETAVSARLAEEQGFDYIGIPDSQSLWRELYLSLSVVANNTSRVRIGPTVTNALTRHPAVAASAIATLNEISEGRAFLGIGSGDSAILNLGLRPARLAELQEYIEALRAILSGDSYDYKGRSIHVQWSEKPVPIIMSAEGPKTLAMAGGIADAVQQAVAGIQGIAGEVHLGDEGLGPGGEDREVHVGRPHPVSRRRREP